MNFLLDKATACLQQLEADRLAAVTAIEEKTWELKLIEARLEGFRQAMKLLGVEPSAVLTDPVDNKPRRVKRRNIRELILTELTFSGGAMTTKQIAAAIDYAPALTEKTLRRLASFGQVMCEKHGRWSALITAPPRSNGAAIADGTFSIGKGQDE